MPAPAEDWTTLPHLRGSLVQLRALREDDAAGYLAALGDDAAAQETYRWLMEPAPREEAAARAQIAAAVAAPGRHPFVQLDAASGAVIGTSSFYEVVPELRTLAIGYTWLGRAWWRTGHNTEAKLLLLGHAFGTLGAVRVVWHTDIFNERSQAAIARLGAQREGVLRKNRIRLDGSWRDTVQYSMTDDEWPAARDRLSARLGAG